MQKALAVGVRVMESGAGLRTRAVDLLPGKEITLVDIAISLNLALRKWEVNYMYM